MQIYNSATGKKETFVPIHEGEVGIYACGPTVYNYFHIGNARPFITFDVLRRQMEREGYKVTFVQNFTDIDDKMIRRANEEGITVKQLGDTFIEEYYKDAAALGIRKATVHPRATEHIAEIITLVQRLIDNGHAYASPSGDVYYRVSAFPGYGKLSGQSMEDRQMGASARLDVETDKENPADFVLWKAQKPGEPAWESPWGMGRPGWHIECSAMSMKYLGETFDIHCGGKDLLFPHHENEIAQSEGATGKPYVHYWMHNGFINVDGEKMSKSLGNFWTVRDISKQYDLEVVRMFMLSAHYRSPIDFSKEQIENAFNGLNRMYTARNRLLELEKNAEDKAMSEAEEQMQQRLAGYEKHFDDAMDNDMNTAEAIGAIFDLVKDANVNLNADSSKQAIAAALKSFKALTDVLGLVQKDQLEIKEEPIPEEVMKLAEERAAARKAKDWKKSDELRDAIKALGYIPEDTAQGQKIRKA
ncbi:MAG: cysteine--tRNA ligase [Clostridia bacterium]|nr:cysteine--tRNA ligase [Clostridia bacterium]